MKQAQDIMKKLRNMRTINKKCNYRRRFPYSCALITDALGAFRQCSFTTSTNEGAIAKDSKGNTGRLHTKCLPTTRTPWVKDTLPGQTL